MTANATSIPCICFSRARSRVFPRESSEAIAPLAAATPRAPFTVVVIVAVVVATKLHATATTTAVISDSPRAKLRRFATIALASDAIVHVPPNVAAEMRT